MPRTPIFKLWGINPKKNNEKNIYVLRCLSNVITKVKNQELTEITTKRRMIKLIMAMMEVIQPRYIFLKTFKDVGKCTPH